MRRTNVKKLISKIPSRIEAMQTTIHSATRDDIDLICNLEQYNFDNAWTRLEFMSHLRKRDCGVLVAVQDRQTVGYLVYRRGRDFVEIQKIAVDYLYRRSGVGRTLVQALFERMESVTSKLSLMVCERDVEAQLFFQKLGFLAVAILRDFYAQTSTDAYIMELEFSSSEPETVARGEFRQKPVALIVKSS